MSILINHDGEIVRVDAYKLLFGTMPCTVRGRVRVAVRLRPRNAEETVADADLPDCVELQPEVGCIFILIWAR